MSCDSTKTHRIAWWLLILIGAIEIIYSSYLFGYSKLFSSPTGSAAYLSPPGNLSVVYFQNGTTATPITPTFPTRITIPAISVDAAIERVGLTGEGAMDVPENQDNTAWFKLGQYPGEIGSAVIAGHYGRNNGKGSVFDELYKLRKGDVVFVEDDTGASTSFVVRDIRRYEPNTNASDVFSSTDGKSHLNLVTCEGTWNNDTESYSKRLVIFTDKVE